MSLTSLEMAGSPRTRIATHPVEDSLEEWFVNTKPREMYSWTDPTVASPGKAIKPPSNQAIINKVAAATRWQPGRTEFFKDPQLKNPNSPANLQQLFYIMYVVNQTGNYFASDGESGNRTERIGWLNSYSGFPSHLHTSSIPGTGGNYVGVANISPQSEAAPPTTNATARTTTSTAGNPLMTSARSATAMEI